MIMLITFTLLLSAFACDFGLIILAYVLDVSVYYGLLVL